MRTKSIKVVWWLLLGWIFFWWDILFRIGFIFLFGKTSQQCRLIHSLASDIWPVFLKLLFVHKVIPRSHCIIQCWKGFIHSCICLLTPKVTKLKYYEMVPLYMKLQPHYLQRYYVLQVYGLVVQFYYRTANNQAEKIINLLDLYVFVIIH